MALTGREGEILCVARRDARTMRSNNGAPEQPAQNSETLGKRIFCYELLLAIVIPVNEIQSYMWHWTPNGEMVT